MAVGTLVQLLRALYARIVLAMHGACQGNNLGGRVWRGTRTGFLGDRGTRKEFAIVVGISIDELAVRTSEDLIGTSTVVAEGQWGVLPEG